jgi:hypothetical protein
VQALPPLTEEQILAWADSARAVELLSEQGHCTDGLLRVLG